ncbi:DUF3108 domain-containing protein [Solimonas sp. K1W22B-7]|uniref:DUF3108 domain-containing protein n=1 Tax=Solimonas sp. K1W22B-7 TaxID=2303331 RepID=UPI0013C4F85A|nr:DUF3108 domain-containing protein [Solimonas sp. K1W22B-7]
MNKLLLGLAMLAAALSAQAAPSAFVPRSDQYQVAWGSMGLGEGTISLSPLQSGCYRYESVTKPMAIVRWTYGSPRETSEFCVADGRIVPKRFVYTNDKRAKDSFTLDFDWAAHQVKTIKGGEIKLRELPDNTYDRFVIQLAVRQWVIKHAGEAKPAPLEVKMVDHRRIKTYRFALTGREKVETPAGKFDTLLVERVDDPGNSLRFWVAPERDYIPVKVQQIDDGELKLQMLLSK